MKLKYKLILLLLTVIIFASFPLSYFILQKQEEEKISSVMQQGRIQTRLLAYSVMNTLLVNGGDIEASRIDTRTTLEMLAPLKSDGIVFAEVILLSSKARYNGIVINSAAFQKEIPWKTGIKRIDEKSLRELRSSGKRGVIQREVGSRLFYQFLEPAAPENLPPLCLGRIIYSRDDVLKPVYRMRKIVYLATLSAAFLVGLIGLFFSRVISGPIERLTQVVSGIEKGKRDFKVDMKRRDEIGKLATTFDHLVRTINLEMNELVAANRELSRMDKLKDDFLANISHELRTPLNGMIGLAESISADAAGKPESEINHDLDLIVKSGKRLTSLVDDILDFSMLKNRDIVLSRKPVDIYSVVNMVFTIMAPLAEGKALTLNNRIEPDEVYVSADVNRLQQIMLNLIGNSMKFTIEGSITVEAEKGKTGGMNLIHVIDTGIGIPEESLERIFNSFEQVDESVSRRFGGTGLGLAVTKQLVELHEGSIEVESELEKGTKFSIALPYAEKPSNGKNGIEDHSIELIKPAEIHREVVSRYKPKMKELNRESTGTVAIVDDDPVNLQVLINVLSSEGYIVRTFATGQEVLDYIKTEIPDCLILDIMLPLMSGFEVCKILRDKFTPYLLPVIMLTARNRINDLVEGLEFGANDYLTKPVNREELITRVKNLVALKKSVIQHNELNIIKHDLEMAHEIHNAVILKDIPDIEGFELAVRFKSMIELGGDFYDVIDIGGGNAGFFVADVSGHGISSAIICTMLKMSFDYNDDKLRSPSKLFSSLNQSLFGQMHDNYITGTYAWIDRENKMICHVNAGHWPILIIREGSDEIISERGRGTPFGWIKDIEYEEISMKLVGGDRIIFYTDGLIEERSPDGEMFGFQKFMENALNFRDRPIDEFADEILFEIRKWADKTSDESMYDDITLIIIDYH